MDVLRRDTDYAMRAMVYLASRYDGTASAKEIAAEGNISDQFASKLLQKLAKAGLVESVMGARGGYKLAKKPEQIDMGQVVYAVQGKILMNKCIAPAYVCSKKESCPVHGKLVEAQKQLMGFFKSINLKQLLEEEQNELTGKERK